MKRMNVNKAIFQLFVKKKKLLVYKGTYESPPKINMKLMRIVVKRTTLLKISK